jgi:hypothetical protein
VNDVSEQTKRQCPNLTISALAYGSVWQAPTFELNTNVVVWLCLDPAGFHDAVYKARLLRNLELWTQRATRVHIYTYGGLNSWIFPRYYPDGASELLMKCRMSGCNDIWMEYRTIPWIDGPETWLCDQMLWAPESDIHQLEAQFCTLAYGRAAHHMKTFFERLRACWEASQPGIWFDGIHDLPRQAQRYSLPVREELMALLNQAIHELSGDTAAQERVLATMAPLQVAFTFAEEIEATRALSDLLNRNASLEDWKIAYMAAKKGIVARQDALAALSRTHPRAFQALAQALETGQTLRRWEERRDTILSSARTTIELATVASSD